LVVKVHQVVQDPKGNLPGRQTGDARLPHAKRAYPAFRHRRSIAGCQKPYHAALLVCSVDLSGTRRMLPRAGFLGHQSWSSRHVRSHR
jgi:hypothetical protein